MPRIAILSDIHANIRALEAVLEDISRMGGCDAIYALGDVIGYGPTPNEVLAIAKQHFSMTLRGNHEHACLHGTKDFNEMARRAIDWPGSWGSVDACGSWRCRDSACPLVGASRGRRSDSRRARAPGAMRISKRP